MAKKRKKPRKPGPLHTKLEPFLATICSFYDRISIGSANLDLKDAKRLHAWLPRAIVYLEDVKDRGFKKRKIPR